MDMLCGVGLVIAWELEFPLLFSLQFGEMNF